MDSDRTVSAVSFDRGRRREAIVAALLSDVLQGRLKAGQRLRTDELARRLGVSHTPIREGLIALAGIGIVDLLPNRGAVVRQVSPRDVREVCEVRRLLECAAVRRACGRIARQELERLAEELRELKADEGRSGEAFLERARALDSRLHDLIAASCGNAFLAHELARLKVLFRAFRDMSWAYHQSRSDYTRLAGEAGEHLAIVEALLAGERRQAVRAMSQHIRCGIRYWMRALPAGTIGADAPGHGWHAAAERRWVTGVAVRSPASDTTATTTRDPRSEER
jgi:DNA-binding GntR family transcriptional regulator